MSGYPEHMSVGDFRCRFQALSALIMKRYGSVFISPDERKVWSSSFTLNMSFLSNDEESFSGSLIVCVFIYQAVEELLIELDLDKKSIVLGQSRVSGCYLLIRMLMNKEKYI